MNRPGLAADGPYADHAGRARLQHELDAEIAAWTATVPADELLDRLRRHAVPCGLIHSAPDLADDPHLAARDMVLRLAAGFDRDVPMAGVVPKLSRTPGRVRAVGPELGEHTDVVLRDLAGLGGSELHALRAAGVIG
jgi:formyl-CoA transferase